MNSVYVIDASVVAKWFLVDEEAADKAAVFLQTFARGEIALVAPALVLYEVARVLQRACSQNRMKAHVAEQRLADLLELNLDLVYRSELLESAMGFALRHECNFYDACYVALAELLAVPLVTADQKLVRQLEGKLDSDYFDYLLRPLARFDLSTM